ncbi:MAG: phytanoyl-CoA dioxygenase family protein, partial [Ilumatobacteraceae bacterium]
MATTLTEEQIEGYHRDGFTVVRDFVDRDTCAELRERALGLVDEWEPGVERTVFTTDEQERHSNKEFLSSGGRIWCFFEDGALDDAGELTRPKELAINKIGHAQHDLDPVFESFSYTDDLAGVAADIGLVDALALQSMYIFKQPGIGGEVACHQDSTFLYTDPLSVTGFWFA